MIDGSVKGQYATSDSLEIVQLTRISQYRQMVNTQIGISPKELNPQNSLGFENIDYLPIQSLKNHITNFFFTYKI